jgi:1-acyl-sn-glycerol-3-phosphate acyltransferase
MSGLRKEIETIAKGWRWGRRPLVPRSVEQPEPEPREFPTTWARTPVAKATRGFIQGALMEPLMHSQTDPAFHGFEILDTVQPPVLFYANHSSHLDAPMLLTSLPKRWRERTAIGAAADYFFDVWWRAAATALVFNAFPVERAGARRSTRAAREMLAVGWNVLVFPEGTRSRDGWVGEFRLGAARLCIESGVPAVPIAVRGTYQSMPRGRGWPAAGRRPVSVRLGGPIMPEPAQTAQEFNDRMIRGLARLLDEDRTTWWESIRREARGEIPSPHGPEAPRWRRTWEASRPLPVTRRARAWR